MAGIGFELKKLYAKQGVFAKVRAAAYSVSVCAGPMLLGTLTLLLIYLACRFFGRPEHDREVLVCVTTYSFLYASVLTSAFSMVVTRFSSDMLYTEHPEAILPSFFGVNAVTLWIGGVTYAGFLCFCGLSLLRGILCWVFFLELVVTCNMQSFLSAVREYRLIALSCLLSMAGTVGVTALSLWLGADTVCGTLTGLITGYGLMMVFDFAALYRHFPDSGMSPYLCLRWFDRFRKLMFCGLFLSLGTVSHLVIVWHSALQTVVEERLICAPGYDLPAFLAYFTTIVTTVGFAVSLEVRFYPKFRDYCYLLNDRGTVRDIVRAEKEMNRTLQRELWYTGLKQLFFTAASISLGEFVLGRLPLGFNNLMFGYFRTLCIAYGIYALADTMLLLLLYYNDDSGALCGAFLFALSASVLTAVSLRLPAAFWGIGFLAGNAVFFVYTVFRLNYRAKRISYFILAAQPVVSESREGVFTKIGTMLERKLDGRKRDRDNTAHQ